MVVDLGFWERKRKETGKRRWKRMEGWGEQEAGK
jgi:hypothetical protein